MQVPGWFCVVEEVVMWLLRGSNSVGSGNMALEILVKVAWFLWWFCRFRQGFSCGFQGESPEAIVGDTA